jgi:hypothetical protein
LDWIPENTGQPGGIDERARLNVGVVTRPASVTIIGLLAPIALSRSMTSRIAPGPWRIAVGKEKADIIAPIYPTKASLDAAGT